LKDSASAAPAAWVRVEWVPVEWARVAPATAPVNPGTSSAVVTWPAPVAADRAVVVRVDVGAVPADGPAAVKVAGSAAAVAGSADPAAGPA